MLRHPETVGKWRCFFLASHIMKSLLVADVTRDHLNSFCPTGTPNRLIPGYGKQPTAPPWRYCRSMTLGKGMAWHCRIHLLWTFLRFFGGETCREFTFDESAHLFDWDVTSACNFNVTCMHSKESTRSQEAIHLNKLQKTVDAREWHLAHLWGIFHCLFLDLSQSQLTDFFHQQWINSNWKERCWKLHVFGWG